MISVDEARTALLSLAAPLEIEDSPVRQAIGRVLARDMSAPRPQPPFPASAMDGYAVPDMAPKPGQTFTIVGTSAAGHPFPGALQDGEAVRIFTGAPVPDHTRHILIQEDVDRQDDRITVGPTPDEAAYIRPAGGDFEAGFVLSGGRVLRPQDIALLGAMGHGSIPVHRAPVVAILSTGDELRAPGTLPEPGTIFASNGDALAGLVDGWGGIGQRLPLVRDTRESLALAFELARDADLLLTVGGASVGDHDLVAPAAQAAGFRLQFQKVAMRPGKPLMAGQKPGQIMVGLPGNPVSAFVCALVFIRPMIARFLGLPDQDETEHRILAAPISANGPRTHYMRAKTMPDGRSRVAERQDSSLLSVLAASDHLVIRPPYDPARDAGTQIRTLALPR
ncbi:MAG: molybdopterin molybdotransferase MoeA [Pseudomonadota bacterium]